MTFSLIPKPTVRIKNWTIPFVGKTEPRKLGELYSETELVYTLYEHFRPLHLSAHVAENSKLIVISLQVGCVDVLPQGSWFGGMLAIHYDASKWIEACAKHVEISEADLFRSSALSQFLKPFELHGVSENPGANIVLRLRNYTELSEAFTFNVHGIATVETKGANVASPSIPNPFPIIDDFNFDDFDGVLANSLEGSTPKAAGPRSRACDKCMAQPGSPCFGMRKDSFHHSR